MRSFSRFKVMAIILAGSGRPSIGVRTGDYDNHCAVYPATRSDLSSLLKRGDRHLAKLFIPVDF